MTLGIRYQRLRGARDLPRLRRRPRSSSTRRRSGHDPDARAGRRARGRQRAPTTSQRPLDRRRDDDRDRRRQRRHPRQLRRPTALQTFLNGIGGTAHAQGQADGDLYEIGLSGTASPTGPRDHDPRRRRLADTATSASTSCGSSAPTTRTSSCCARTWTSGVGMVAAFQVDANGSPVPGGFFERDRLRRRHQRRRCRSSAATATTRSCSTTTSRRRRSSATRARHVPDRPGLPVGARRLEPEQRPRAPDGLLRDDADDAGYLSQRHQPRRLALRRRRQRQLHRLPQPRRAVPLRRGGRRHVPRPRLRPRQPGRPDRRRSPTSTAARAPTSSPTRSTRRCASTAATASTR